MAKLSAHGQELERIESKVETPHDDLAAWTRTTRVYMSDGVRLSKRDVCFRSATGIRSYGWKRDGKILAGYQENLGLHIDLLVAGGKWKRVS